MQEPVVILANGEFPTHSTPLGILQEAGYIICCDGAVNQLDDEGLAPSVIIGDLDSVSAELKEKYANKLVHLPSQEENDLRKAIQWAEGEGLKEATILGATGKREDHSLANLFTLLQYPTEMELELFTDFGKFSTAKGKQSFDSFNGQQVSLFSTNSEIKITSTNLKYNLKCSKLINLYSGSLNESEGKSFSLDISGGRILIFQSFS